MRTLIRWLSYGLSLLLVPFAVQAGLIINPGFDLLKTASRGSYVDLPGIGRVELVGNPLPGFTSQVDTIVQRQQGCDFNFTNPCTVDIQLVELSLQSREPVNIGGTLFDLFVTESSTQSLGSMTITLNAAGDGGTFNATLPVNADLTFTEVGNPPNIQVFSFFDVFTSLDVPWSTIAPPGWPSSSSYPAGGFYPGVLPPSETGAGPRLVGFDEQALLARHRIPEPATLALFGAGLGLLGWRRRRA